MTIFKYLFIPTIFLTILISLFLRTTFTPPPVVDEPPPVLSDKAITALYNYALALKNAKKYAEAQVVLEQTLSTHPLSKELFLLLNDVYSQRSKRACFEVIDKYKGSLLSSKDIVASRVLTALDSWRESWEKQNYALHQSMYSSDFKGVFKLRDSWEKDRQIKISSPDYIKISLEGVKLMVVSDEVISTTFTQVYNSPNYQSRKQKNLIWLQKNDKWQIVSESSLGI